ncbi:nucleotidyltransferase domain-containing protein [Halorhabdus sp. BNX81]|uniref:type VII toxin-antitoxin system MntA family adenylyltransferase antitoxin n=1 Tax=Halorhabdus sp. BNX81 TaxID=2980181 RepID=UPI0023DD2CB7|nr:nucleotidyltransferase domain-containing protein [Halorhabdus sp. BNX81]WEL20668.1 Nucleotidyltransferase domain-containing protein [Halorhabdus sp. BNX81]
MTNDRADPSVEGSVDIEGIRRYLAETDVAFAVLFGSFATGSSRDSSDVDVAVQFPAAMTPKERFHRRNRIDAELQAYADRFVDVSDIENLPLPVVRRALQDGIRLVGDQEDIDAYRGRIEAEYETSAAKRKRERQEFIDRLAKGEL